jgi:hypothetical protein
LSIQAVLGVGAKADQRNLVQLTIKDSAGDKTILDQPILSLSLNKNDSVGNELFLFFISIVRSFFRSQLLIFEFY